MLLKSNLNIKKFKEKRREVFKYFEQWGGGEEQGGHVSLSLGRMEKCAYLGAS